MRIIVYILICLNLSWSSSLAAEATADMKWTAARSGKSLRASATSLVDGVVTLRKINGEEIKVPLKQLILKNRNFLLKHFAEEEEEPEEKEDDKEKNKDVKDAKHFPVEQGEVSQAIEASATAKYHVYIPDSLTKDTKDVPLLFYISGGGGEEKHLDDLTGFAESFGWILAVSVDNHKSKKNPQNLTIANDCTEHLIRTLPINKKRVYLAGHQDGGALAIMLSERIKADGVITINGYTDDAWSPNANHYYFLAGAKSKMRYATAFSHKKFPKSSPYVLYDGNTKIADEDYLFDAMLWMHVNYLGSAKARHKEETVKFEKEMLTRIKENIGNDSQRAYLHALMLRDDYKIEDDGKKELDGMIKELEKEKKNKLYIKGREEFPKIAKKYLCGEGKIYKTSYKDDKLVKGCVKLATKYKDVPYITEVLEALQEATD